MRCSICAASFRCFFVLTHKQLLRKQKAGSYVESVNKVSKQKHAVSATF